MIRSFLLPATLILLLAGCSSVRETEPGRTAQEQLLFSTAAERAVDRLSLTVPAAGKVFVDPAYAEGTDSKYLLSLLRDRVLREGAYLTDDRAQADMVIEPRIGAMSVDRGKYLIGISTFDVPIPLTGDLSIPDIALYKRDRQQGVIKVALTSYDAKTGALGQSLGPVYGFSQKTDWSAFFIFSWSDNDLMPELEKEGWVGK